MRRMLVSLLGLFAGLLVVVPAPPAAAAATGITISGPASVASGGTATITGRLSTGRAPLAGELMFLNKSLDGVSWSLVGIATTGSLGTATVNATNLTVTTRFRWSYPGDTEAGYDPSTSPIHTVSVASDPGPTQPTLTIGGPDAVESGGSAEISTQMTQVIPPTPESPGLTLPVSGKTVTLSRSVDGSTWTPVGTAVTDVAGRATRVDTGLTTTTQYRWTFAGDGDYLPATSPTHVVLVASDPGDPSPTALSIHAEPAWIGTRQSTEIVGKLWSGGEPVEGQQVALRARPDGASSWTTIASRTTDSDGLVSATVSPVSNTLYQWRFAGTDDFHWSVSPSAGVTINDQAPTRLTIAVDPASVFEGGAAWVRGTLATDAGPRPNRPLVLERSTNDGASWHELVTVATGPNGVARHKVTPAATALYRWRFDETQTLFAAQSAVAKIETRPPLVTNLTISTSKGVVTFGEPVVLRAVLLGDNAPVAGASVELWAEAFGFEGRVATLETDDKGMARFQVRPSIRTRYWWRFAGDVGLRPARSPNRDIDVRYAVQANAKVVKALGKRYIRVTGVVAPPFGRPKVDLIRDLGPLGTGTLVTSTVDDSGGFTLVVKNVAKGKYSLFVKARKTATLQTGRSASLTVKVK